MNDTNDLRNPRNDGDDHRDRKSGPGKSHRTKPQKRREEDTGERKVGFSGEGGITENAFSVARPKRRGERLGNEKGGEKQELQ